MELADRPAVTPRNRIIQRLIKVMKGWNYVDCTFSEGGKYAYLINPKLVVRKGSTLIVPDSSGNEVTVLAGEVTPLTSEHFIFHTCIDFRLVISVKNSESYAKDVNIFDTIEDAIALNEYRLTQKEANQ